MLTAEKVLPIEETAFTALLPRVFSHKPLTQSIQALFTEFRRLDSDQGLDGFQVKAPDPIGGASGPWKRNRL